MYISVSHSRPSTDQPYENSEAILKIIVMKTKQSTPLMKQLYWKNTGSYAIIFLSNVVNFFLEVSSGTIALYRRESETVHLTID